MVKNGQDSTLTAKHHALIAALLEYQHISEAAEAAGVPDHTARRWMKHPEFKAALEAAQQELFDAALTRLKTRTNVAIDTLLRHMEAEDTPAGVQVQAAQIWLRQAIEQHKTRDLERKLDEALDLVRGKTP